jgi:hypothetical protein
MTVAQNVALGLGVFAAQSAFTFGILSLSNKNTDYIDRAAVSIAIPLMADTFMLPPALALLRSQKHKHH